MTEPTLEQVRAGAKAMWAAGDYRPIGERLRPAAVALVDRAGVGDGDRVLDVGVGTGNVAVAAAGRGAEVVGIDISEHWWDAVRDHAAAEGVEVDLRLGDAEELPFDDGSFDAVLSSFAMIFAPRHDQVVDELVRVTRPGGVIAFTSWPRSGGINKLREAFADHLPPPPSWAQTPDQWGDPATVQERFARHGVEVEITDGELAWAFRSVDDYASWLVENSGPLQRMLQALEDQGLGDDARRTLRDALAESGDEVDGAFRDTLRYLVVVGQRGSDAR